MLIFDPALLCARSRRADRLGAGAPPFFLWRRMARDLGDRVLDIARPLPAVAEIAPIPLVFNDDLRARKDVAQAAHHVSGGGVLALPPAGLDALVMWGGLHWVDDLPGLLVQARRALKPDGVFLGALVGGESLRELRDCLAAAEMELLGGISPRVSPMATLHDCAALLQRAGFALPVADHDVLTVTYPDLRAMIADLRLSGQTNAVIKQNRAIVPRAFWPRVEELYRARYSENGRLIATIEIISLIGWAPHASQQQPSQRGSATHRLADILHGEEKGAGDFI